MTSNAHSPLALASAGLLFGAFILLLGACGESKESPKATAPTTSEIFSAGREGIETLRRKRWAITLSPMNALTRWHGKTLNWDAMPDGPEKDQLAKELSTQWESEGQPVAQRLLDIAPAADAVHSVREGITGLIDSLMIPPEVVFPARTRFDEAWLPALHERFKLVTQGLQDFLINGKDERYVIGAAGLPALAKEGQALKQEISEVGYVFTRYERSCQALVAQQGLIKRVLTQEPKNLQALKAAEAVRESLAASKTRWAELLPRLVNPKTPESIASHRSAVETLAKELQAVLDSCNAAIRPAAKRLGFLR